MMGAILDFPSGEAITLTSVPREVVAALCLKYAGPLPGTDDGVGNHVDGARLLWAISGNESSFGANCKPRHEPAYDVDGLYYKRSQLVRNLVRQFGSDGACSYGPWQLMLCNAHHSPAELRSDPAVACEDAVHYIRFYVLGFRKARTLAEILDTYNTGNWREQDEDAPTKYMRDGMNYYHSVPLPAPASS